MCKFLLEYASSCLHVQVPACMCKLLLAFKTIIYLYAYLYLLIKSLGGIAPCFGKKRYGHDAVASKNISVKDRTIQIIVLQIQLRRSKQLETVIVLCIQIQLRRFKQLETLVLIGKLRWLNLYLC